MNRINIGLDPPRFHERMSDALHAIGTSVAKTVHVASRLIGGVIGETAKHLTLPCIAAVTVLIYGSYDYRVEMCMRALYARGEGYWYQDDNLRFCMIAANNPWRIKI